LHLRCFAIYCSGKIDMMRLMGKMADREPWWAEFWAACNAICWVLWAVVLTNGGLNELPGFRLVIFFIPEWVWYITGMVGGIAQVFALRANDPRARWNLCMFMAGWWTIIFLGLIQAVESTPGLFFYLSSALVNYYSVYRLRNQS
jgi:hypothetical protein